MAQALSEDELLRLLDVLADGGWHSGERLAEASGISRAALAKRVDKLRDWQLDVEAQQGLGYRLAAPLERLRLPRFAPLPLGGGEAGREGGARRREPPLPNPSPARGEGLKVSVLAVTDSTNTQLLDADPAQDPQALFAEFQTAGRGRRGREWVSPFGANLYFSLAWSFRSWPAQITALPLAVGLTCARVLREAGLPAAGIKWPNDLYANGRKLGGILIEHRGEAGGPCRAVIGIGLNVNMSAPQAQAVSQPWTSLQQEMSAPQARGPLAERLLAALQAALEQFEREGFAPFAAQWPRYDLTLDKPVRVIGGPDLEGTARGIDASGALLVESQGQRHALHSGEVSLRLA